MQLHVFGAVRMQEAATVRAEEAAFDASRLADFAERIHFNAPATALSPLVREAGRLVGLLLKERIRQNTWSEHILYLTTHCSDRLPLHCLRCT